jgi:hypothetical protein
MCGAVVLRARSRACPGSHGAVLCVPSLAFRRCVSLEIVVGAAGENRLADIVRMHDYAGPMRIEMRNLARLEHLYRLKLLHILQDG